MLLFPTCKRAVANPGHTELSGENFGLEGTSPDGLPHTAFQDGPPVALECLCRSHSDQITRDHYKPVDNPLHFFNKAIALSHHLAP